MTARASAEPPTAQEILDQVRLQQAQQQLDLQGQLRSDATVIPFRITQTGPVIRYTFANPPEVLQLRLGEKSSSLDLVLENSTKKFAASRLDDKIGGTARHLRRSRAQVSLLADARKSWAKKSFARAPAGNCACSRHRATRNTRMFSSGSTRTAAR